LTPLQRENAHKALDDVIKDVHAGVIHSFRMKIRGVHAPAYGGQDGGRKIHMDREGFTVIRISGNRMKRDVIENPVGSLKGNGHPAIFPERVIRELVRMLSPEGGVVLDHYVGSGTTLVAALKERRNSIGVDISQEYCDAAAQRLLYEDCFNGLLL
jgi:site-specific DNA-methyltransferase (adenine-specific)